MNASGWIQLLLFAVALAAITKPMGIYLLRVLDPDQEGGMGFLEKIFGPVERLVYKIARVNPKKQQNWKQYAIAMLMLGMITTVLSYGLYRIQDILPLKQNMANLSGTVDKTGVITGAQYDKDGKLIAGGKIPLTWAGRHGTILQVTTNLQGTNIAWTSLYNTDGTGATNYPVTGPKQFFKLVQPLYWPTY